MESNEIKETKKQAWERWRKEVISRRGKKRPRVKKQPTNLSSRSITKALRQLVLIRDNYTCQYCGIKGDPAHYDLNNWRGVDWIRYDAKGVVLEIDHVIPPSEGGKTIANNLVVSCFTCNRSKRHKPLKEWKI